MTEKVGLSLNDTDSDTSDDEQFEVPEQVTDPDNPWLAERKDFKDFMTGYTNFVQNNFNIVENNDYDKIKFNNEDNDVEEFNKLNNDQLIELKKKKKNVKTKIKYTTIKDLADFNDDESDVEALRIVSPQKKKVQISNTIEPETKRNEIEKNINMDSQTLNNKKNLDNKIEVVNTVAGTWFVTSDNINTKKMKTHKDVQNAFKTVEVELKNKISEKLKILNDINKKQPKKNKCKSQKVENNYLKMNNKHITELNEPLCEDIKTLDKISSNNIGKSEELNIKIKKKPIKPAVNIGPSQVLQVSQTNLETEEMDRIEDHLDDKEENEQEMLIAEAFADDDIINEFKY